MMSANSNNSHHKLGQRLLAEGKLSPSQLAKALEKQKEDGRYLGRILIDSGYIEDGDLQDCLPKDIARERTLTMRLHESFDATEFYRLHTALKFALFSDDPLKTLLIASALPREGKTTCANYFARVLASVSEGRFLLVDADLGNPTLHKRYDVPATPGWTDYLVNGHRLQECFTSTDIENLKLLPAGTLPPNPVALFSSKKMKDLIDSLKEMFDFIVFDSTPLIASPSASILSTNLDAAIMVVNAGHAKRRMVKKAVAMLEESKVKILGVILNQVVDHDTPKYVYGYSGVRRGN